ncbi:MAG: antitoxin, partial [Firmicutes bacterium]|nr:antitoxin [Bacillota bacterium]
AKLVQEYVAANDLNLSSFVRELILDKIEDDLALDEERIINARTRAANEASYDHIEVWKKLGV